MAGSIRIFTATSQAPATKAAVREFFATIEAPTPPSVAKIRVIAFSAEAPGVVVTSGVRRYVTIDGVRRVIIQRVITIDGVRHVVTGQRFPGGL